MGLIAALVFIPLAVAVLLMLFRTDRVRDVIVVGSAAIIAVVSVATAVAYLGKPTSFAFTPELSLAGNYVAVAVDLFLCGFVFVQAIRCRNRTMLALSAVQLAVSIWCGSFALHPEDASAAPMYIDTLSVIMVLIVGLVGSAICIYALGYMKDFQHHEDEAAEKRGEQTQDRRHQFIALMFLFLSAMFIIVTADNLDWLVAGWEITTVCSYLMIGFTRTADAKRSATLQINLNMVGGLAFHVALVMLHIAGVPLAINSLADIAAGPQASLLITAAHAFHRRPHQGGSDAVSQVAARRHGRTDTHECAAAFLDYGQGRRVPARETRPALHGLPGGIHHGCHGGRRDVCALQLPRH